MSKNFSTSFKSFPSEWDQGSFVKKNPLKKFSPKIIEKDAQVSEENTTGKMMAVITAAVKKISF